MEWGVAIIFVFLLLISYVIVQETRAQLHWRGLVQQGDVEAIRALLEAEVEAWHNSRVPKGTPALLWHGIQTVELLGVTAVGARLSCNAEGEYSLVAGRRIESSSPVAEGKKITKKLAEMVLYDVPNVKLDHVQIDVYTSFRDAGGHAETRCILSTNVKRSLVSTIDWEEIEPDDFVLLTAGRFDSDNEGGLKTIEPLQWQEEPARTA